MVILNVFLIVPVYSPIPSIMTVAVPTSRLFSYETIKSFPISRITFPTFTDGTGSIYVPLHVALAGILVTSAFSIDTGSFFSTNIASYVAF